MYVAELPVMSAINRTSDHQTEFRLLAILALYRFQIHVFRAPILLSFANMFFKGVVATFAFTLSEWHFCDVKLQLRFFPAAHAACTKTYSVCVTSNNYFSLNLYFHILGCQRRHLPHDPSKEQHQLVPASEA